MWSFLCLAVDSRLRLSQTPVSAVVGLAAATTAPLAVAPPAAKPGSRIELCRTLFDRFAQGQELLRRNHGVPVLNQQAVLDIFITYLSVQCRVPAEVTEMLQRMRAGSLMNNAGGTTGGRLQLSNACLIKEPAFFDSVCNDFFRSGPTCHFELFPSTTKSIEASSFAAPHNALLAPARRSCGCRPSSPSSPSRRSSGSGRSGCWSPPMRTTAGATS